jgi:hypothetical protein
MGLVSLLMYAGGFAWLRCRNKPPDLLEKLRLGALLFTVAAVVIAWFARGRVLDHYSALLCFGVAAGQGMGFWQQWATAKRGVESSRPHGNQTLPEHASEGAATPISGPVLLFSFWVVSLLTASVLWQSGPSSEFFYRGVSRWTGIWTNPNSFGIMMALGVVLSLGGLATWWRARTPAFEGKSGSASRPSVKWALRAHALVCGLCLPVLAWGLLHSYSRGAWLGLAVALAWQVYRCRTSASSLPSDINPTASAFRVPPFVSTGKEPEEKGFWERLRPFAVPVLIVSLLILAFWTWRTTEFTPVRRAFSSVNPNDFSWRNRAAAWLGAMQIMAEHPWAGAGWNQVEQLYNTHYRPPRVSEGGALQTNDYLLIGAAMGPPTLAALGLYFWITLGFASRRAERNAWCADGWCRTAALGLLVSAWFDGALLAWPGGVLAWALLELNPGGREQRMEDIPRTCQTPIEVSAVRRVTPHNRRLAPGRLMTALAMIAALAAIAISSVQIGLPRLPANTRTLAWARQVLNQPGEQADFDYLCREVNWTGERLQAPLDHLRLARYNRELVEWKINEPLFREFVLSPKIEGAPTTAYDWRRTLWEHCRLHVRKEATPASTAAIVVGLLRSRVSVTSGAVGPVSPGAALERQIISPEDFEWLYVAALRAAGIPARLNGERQAEFWSGELWTPAPRPLAERSRGRPNVISSASREGCQRESFFV